MRSERVDLADVLSYPVYPPANHIVFTLQIPDRAQEAAEAKIQANEAFMQRHGIQRFSPFTRHGYEEESSEA